MRTSLTVAAVLCVLFFSSCSNGPQAIRFGSDGCDFCKMAILDERFGGEVITQKGKVYKFDDIHCITSFLKSNNLHKPGIAGIYLLNYSQQKQWVKAPESYLLQSNDLHSPMGGNTAAFFSETQRQQVQQQLHGTTIQWNDLTK